MLRYDNSGQAKIVRHIKKSSIKNQLTEILKQQEDFEDNQLRQANEFITSNAESVSIWTREVKSSETYQVHSLKDGIKVVVLNVEDRSGDDSYEFVNKFLVRR